MRSLSTFVWVYVFSLLSGTVVGAIFHNHLFLVQELVALALGAYFQAAITLTVLSSVRGKRLELDEALRKAWPYTLYMFMLTLMLAVTAVVTFVLFIVPAFIILPRLYLAPYLLIDKKLNPGEAFKASWEMTRGNVGKVWGIIGVNLLMVLPVITIIGIILSAYLLVMFSAAIGVLYIFLSHSGNVPADPKPAS